MSACEFVQNSETRPQGPQVRKWYKLGESGGCVGSQWEKERNEVQTSVWHNPHPTNALRCEASAPAANVCKAQSAVCSSKRTINTTPLRSEPF